MGVGNNINAVSQLLASQARNIDGVTTEGRINQVVAGFMAENPGLRVSDSGLGALVRNTFRSNEVKKDTQGLAVFSESVVEPETAETVLSFTGNTSSKRNEDTTHGNLYSLGSSQNLVNQQPLIQSPFASFFDKFEALG